MQENRKIRHGIISSWIVIGMSLILFIAVAILAAMNFNREKQVMQEVLSEKGSALIKSFEAGTRTGMMGRFGSGSRLQTLLMETAAQKDILYIVLVDQDGKVLAHSDPNLIGSRFLPASVLAGLKVSDTTAWRTLERDGRPVSFEVYKKFLPVLARPRRDGRQRMMDRPQGMMGRGNNSRGEAADPLWCDPDWMEGLPQERILDQRERPVIFVGMDPTPYVEARSEDFKLTFLTSAIVILLGMAGVVSLYWAQSYMRSKKLLQDTRAFASEMIANLPEGIIATESSYTITFINDIAVAMLGLERESIIGKPAAEVLPSNLNELILSPTAEQKIVDRELQLDNSTGQVLTVSASATDIVTDEGNFVGLMLILRDLTQVRRLQETVRKQEKLAAIGNLAAGVAHEVRNPLSSIKGYATYFGSLFEAGSEKREAAMVMTAEVDRLNRVISELLEIARPSDINSRDTDLAFLINSSLRLVRQDAEAANVWIETVLDPNIGTLSVDPDRITQALINLYLNGIQAMPDGGTLTITAEAGEKTISISVADTGSGIPESALANIFDPYYTTKNTGTGLGLAVVQKVVEAHGGTIQVRSEENKGAIFTMYLPGRAPKEEEKV